MRGTLFVLLVGIVMFSCDDQRVYESYNDFEDKQWIVTDQPVFEFDIDDTTASYNIYCNLRNAESYQLADFRFTYYLQDSLNNLLDKKLVTEYLFDKKTGKPFGSSGLGDIYDHQFLVLKDQSFRRTGKFKMKLEQYMRMDTLKGIIAVGVRVEKAEKEN